MSLEKAKRNKLKKENMCVREIKVLDEEDNKKTAEDRGTLATKLDNGGNREH